MKGQAGLAWWEWLKEGQWARGVGTVSGPGEGGSWVHWMALIEGGSGYWRQGPLLLPFFKGQQNFSVENSRPPSCRGIQASAFNPSD